MRPHDTQIPISHSAVCSMARRGVLLSLLGLYSPWWLLLVPAYNILLEVWASRITCPACDDRIGSRQYLVGGCRFPRFLVPVGVSHAGLISRLGNGELVRRRYRSALWVALVWPLWRR